MQTFGFESGRASRRRACNNNNRGWIREDLGNRMGLAVSLRRPACHLALLATAQTQSEAVIVGLLILVVLTQAHKQRVQALESRQRERRDFARFLQLRTHLGESPSVDERETLRQLGDESLPASDWIHIVFAWLAGVLTIGRLVLAVIE